MQDMGVDREALEPFRKQLGELPFVRSVKVETEEDTVHVVLSLAKSSRVRRFKADLRRTHLSYAVVDQVLGSGSAFSDEDSILLAPYIAPPMARYLASKRVNFLDLAGNCRLVVDDFVVSIEGKKPLTVTRDRGVRAPGYAVMFALLADPALLAEPVREIARHAGVSKSAVSDIVSRLRDEGFVIGSRRKALSRRDELLSRLLIGYSDVLRPRLLLGRFRLPKSEPDEVENALADSLGNEPDWGWGGVSAARRLQLGYQGPEVTVHVDRRRPELDAVLRRLRAIESRDGDLVLLGFPGEIARPKSVNRVVHPLLVYLELMTAASERQREAGTELREKVLGSD